MMQRWILPMLCTVLAAGCGQNSDDLRAYVDDLGQRAGVEDISVSVTKPFPLTVEGAVDVQLEPTITRAQFDAFAKQACEEDPKASVRFDFEVELVGDTKVSQGGLGQCWKVPGLLVELVPALRETSGDVGVIDWSELQPIDKNGGRLRLDKSQLSSGARGADVARSIDVIERVFEVVREEVPVITVQGDVNITKTSIERAEAVVAASRALVGAQFDLAGVDAQEDGVLWQVASGDTTEAEQVIKRAAPSLTGVRVIDGGVKLQGTSVPDDAIDLAAKLQAANVGWIATASPLGVNVAVRGTKQAREAFQVAGAAGLGDVVLEYEIRDDGGTVFEVKPSRRAPALTRAELNARLAVIDDMRALHPVKTMMFARGGLVVTLELAQRDDAADVAGARSALLSSIKRNGLTGDVSFVKLDGRVIS